MMKLQSGDIFLVHGTSTISKLIRWSEKFFSQDNEAKASHAGIITAPWGATFEALYNGIKRSNLYQQYEGSEIVIFRHKDMTPDRFAAGYNAVLKYEDIIYPYWRLLVHSIPVLSKYIHLAGIPVCSELVAEFLYKAFVNNREVNDLMMQFRHWWGMTPDELEDMLIIHKLFEVVFSGALRSE